MKILIVRPQLEWGGASNSIFRLTEALLQSGHDVLLAVAGGELLPQACARGLAVFRVPLDPSSPVTLIRAVLALRKIVLADQVDVLHSHHRFSNLVCRLVSIWTGVPLVTTVHEYKYNLRYLTRFGLSGSVITFSHNLRRHLVSHFRVPAEKVTVVEMGIRDAVPQSAAGSGMQNGFRIGCFARLVEEKGVDVLLKAAAEPALQGRTNVEFLVVGDGPQRSNLEAQARRVGSGFSFRFLGWVDAIETILPDMDFIVLPSRTEGFGMVILEALRYRKPSIASRVGSIPELIEDGRTGLLVSPDDPRELAEAIAALLDDGERVQSMGEAGFSRIEGRYSARDMGVQVVEVYRKAMEGKRSK